MYVNVYDTYMYIKYYNIYNIYYNIYIIYKIYPWDGRFTGGGGGVGFVKIRKSWPRILFLETRHALD